MGPVYQISKITENCQNTPKLPEIVEIGKHPKIMENGLYFEKNPPKWVGVSRHGRHAPSKPNLSINRPSPAPSYPSLLFFSLSYIHSSKLSPALRLDKVDSLKNQKRSACTISML